HRDVKPENMLLGPNGEVLLSDFGIALLAHSSRSQSTQDAVGTVTYMAPEQLQGHPRPASDQYALAVVVYEWLAGSKLFDGSFTEIASQHLFAPPPPLRQKAPTISPLVEQVVMTALAKKPEERFGSVRAFANALEQAARAEPTLLSATTQVMPPSTPGTPASQIPTPPPSAFAPTQARTPSTPGIPSGPNAPTPPVSPAMTPPLSGFTPTPASASGAMRVSGPLPPTPVSAPLPGQAGGGTPPPVFGGQNFSGVLRRSGPLAPSTPLLPVAAPSPRRSVKTLFLVVLVLLALVSGSAALIWARSGGVVLSPGPVPTPTGTATLNQGSVPPQGKRGGTVTDGLLAEPDSLLSNRSVSTYSALVDATIWAPLLYGDAQGNLQPGLLLEVPSLANGGITADAMHYVLKLRPELKWSDGQPITADDVVFTLDLWSNPAYQAVFTPGLPYVAGYVASDVTTVILTLKQPYSPFLAQQLADPQMALLPRHVFGAMDPASIPKSSENFLPQVVSGPFQMQERVKGDHITVVRNRNYYQAAQGYPYLDKIVFKIISDASVMLTALQAGQIDTSWNLDASKLVSYKAIQGYTLTTTQYPDIFEEALFNLRNPILADLQVRKAISTSIDLDTIITQVRYGAAQRTCDDAVGSFAHNASASCYPFDPAGAKQLLDDDSWALGSDGYRHKNGQKLELRWSTTANNAVRQQTEEIAQANLKDLGIQIDIINYPANTYFGTVLPGGNFDIAEYANQLGYDPDNAFSWLCKETPDKDPNGFNWGYYCNPTVDQAIATEEANTDQSARLNAFRTIQQAILTDLPAIYLSAYGNLAIAKNTLHNYLPSGNGPTETWNVWQWWLG
ncbi:MAG TPA: ABC transporter substrate-binding protein, partial [Ktedonobacterales bacterium]